MEMSDPWMERQPEPLLGATQLVFGRSFDGRLGGAAYFELSHELTLRHGLHWLEEKHGWCRYDQSGEIAVLAGVDEAYADDRIRGNLFVHAVDGAAAFGQLNRAPRKTPDFCKIGSVSL